MIKRKIGIISKYEFLNGDISVNSTENTTINQYNNDLKVPKTHWQNKTVLLDLFNMSENDSGLNMQVIYIKN